MQCFSADFIVNAAMTSLFELEGAHKAICRFVHLRPMMPHGLLDAVAALP